MEDELQKNWHEVKITVSGKDDYSEIINGRRQTSLENLSRRYKRFSIIALICMVWVPLIYLNPNVLEHGRFVVSFASVIYFGVCSIMDRWLYHGIKSIDCMTMTVAEVSSKALFYRKRHLQFVAILLPCAFMWIGLVAYMMDYNKYTIWGMAFGAVIGLAIGSWQLLAFLSDYKNITK